MLQKLDDHIADCLARAADAERRAAEASSEVMRADNESMARSWRHLARSYEFVQSLERFLLDADNAKGARPLDPPVETEAFKFPPGAVFDSDAIAVLTAVYNKAIEGQSPSVREIIAKRIIELASEGECDPDTLCHRALALSMREPRVLRPGWRRPKTGVTQIA